MLVNNMKRLIAVSVCLVLAAGLMAGALSQLSSAVPSAWAGPAGGGLTLVPYAQGLAEPVDIASTGLPDDQRLFIVEREGSIQIVEPDGNVLSSPFLDIQDRVRSDYVEEGLLGLAFSPDYASTGHFFVYYVNNSGNLQLSRFSVSTNPNVANTTETPILTIPHPDAPNHNGGDLAFGPDGYLYLAPGDGGGGGDPGNDAQRLDSLLGKVLRLNVAITATSTYTVPATNPFVGVSGARGEIWSLGLRNPWRFSFDRLTGDLYISDVGQGQREEISFQPAGSAGGDNFGWRCYEGNRPYDLNTCGGAAPANYLPPVFDYDRSQGTTVTGGFVYRGNEQPGLYGFYFFADFGSGQFWALQPDTWNVISLGDLVSSPSTFGEGAGGELFVASFGGTIYRLTGAIYNYRLFLPLIDR